MISIELLDITVVPFNGAYYNKLQQQLQAKSDGLEIINDGCINLVHFTINHLDLTTGAFKGISNPNIFDKANSLALLGEMIRHTISALCSAKGCNITTLHSQIPFLFNRVDATLL